MKIPFNRVHLTGQELPYIEQAIAKGHLCGDGQFTKACARLLEERMGCARVLLTPSCTAALEMAAMLLEVGPEDEVILPSYTFVSTANAVLLRGARPVFVDIRPDTLNLDDEQIEAAISPRTRAIFPVHYAGVGCRMERIMAIARRHHLGVCEDAAQAVDATYQGKPLGSFGQLSALSFHESKNFVCGEGGALCINDPQLIDRAEIIREKGTNRNQFFRGEVDKYTWVDTGSSYLPSELASAFLLAQLERLSEITARRRKVYDFYHRELAPLEEAGLIARPQIPADCQSNFHMYYVLVKDEATRNELLTSLKARGIHAVFHYVPLHGSPMGQRLGYKAGDFPITEQLSGRLVRLPFFCDITPDEQRAVVQGVAQFFGHPARREA